jgi:hypothetical protein
MGRGSECGRGRCSKRRWGAWAGDVARNLGVRARVLVHGGHGKAELTGGPTAQREGTGALGETGRRTNKASPRDRGAGGAGGRQLAATARPHWAERGRE